MLDKFPINHSQASNASLFDKTYACLVSSEDKVIIPRDREFGASTYQLHIELLKKGKRPKKKGKGKVISKNIC